MDETMVLCPPCFACGKQGIVVVPTDGYEAWQAGALIQNALPSLTAADREVLMTGTHEHCWEAMFGADA